VTLLAISSWVPFARLTYGEALTILRRDYVVFAQASGSRAWRVAVEHVVPNIVSPLIALGSFQLAQTFVLESGLSFLGLGIQPPQPDWGQMISEGQGYLTTAWWLSVPAGVTVTALVLAINVLADGARRAGARDKGTALADIP
jgi:peptide/nickel transport system permease protein